MDLKTRQKYPLDLKIEMTKLRIRQWYRHYHGKVYVSVSGKDSTTLLDIVRSIYPKIPGLFINTGLEFPEIVDFIKQTKNVIIIKPKIHFKQVIEKVGWPIISKQVSMAISRYRNTKSEVQKQLRKWGGINPTSGKKQTTGVIPKKYHYLIDAPFKISERCCDFLKKTPYKKFNKECGFVPFVGMLASDSNLRQQQYYKTGCNNFGKSPTSNPMMFWTEKDIWEYVKTRDLKISEIYSMGYTRTGCIFCLFGLQKEAHPNRFDLLKQTHRKQYDFCMDVLKMREVLTFIEENGNGKR